MGRLSERARDLLYAGASIQHETAREGGHVVAIEPPPLNGHSALSTSGVRTATMLALRVYVVATCTERQHCILNVLGRNLGLHIGHPDSGISWFSSVHPGKATTASFQVLSSSSIIL
jgi:hypothetical protein